MPIVRIKRSGPRLLPKHEPRPLRPKAPVVPLTHHEILALMAPFSRRGLHADLAASEREQRRLAFKPDVLPADDTRPVALTSSLCLEAAPAGARPGKHRLIRRVRDGSGLESTLSADGVDLERLLEQLQQVPVERQFVFHEGIPVARSYLLESASQALAQRAGDGAKRAARTVGGRLLASALSAAERVLGDKMPGRGRGTPGAADAAAPEEAPEALEAQDEMDEGLILDEDGPLRPVLVEANTRVGPLSLNLKLDRFIGVPAEFKVTPDPGVKLKAPEDLFAVIDWPFRPMRQIVSYWRGSIKVAPHEPHRTVDAEVKLGRTVEHLATTLAAPPALFHDRHRGARWRVAYQRAVPLLVLLGIMAATPAIQWLELEDKSLLRMLIFHAPPFMLVGFFVMREMPRFEIPPLPRRLTQREWFTRLSDRSAPVTDSQTDAEPGPAGSAASARRQARGAEVVGAVREAEA